MKITKLLTITALTTFAAGAFATNCPFGSELQFHQLATQYTGYWTGNTNDGTPLVSLNMTIPYQIFNNGFTVQFNNEIAGQGFTTCVYYLRDNITGVKTSLFKVSSVVHHAS